MKVTFAVAMWQHPSTGEWKCFAEGWELNGRDRSSIRASVEQACGEIAPGQPLYWRFVEAEVPEPEQTLLTLEGHLVEDDLDTSEVLGE